MNTPFVQIYQAAFPELVGYLTQLLGERAAAEDLAQEAGMRLLAQDPAALRDPRAFLFHVATNLARDQLRRRMVRERVDPADLEPEAEHAADVVAAAREELAQLQRLIGRLPDRPREVLLRSRVEGQSHAEIASALGITAKTVENHLARALTTLVRAWRGGR